MILITRFLEDGQKGLHSYENFLQSRVRFVQGRQRCWGSSIVSIRNCWCRHGCMKYNMNVCFFGMKANGFLGGGASEKRDLYATK